MGDNWKHPVVIQAVEAGEANIKHPRYIDGARRAPPEDVGGIPGLENFLDVIADPKHPEYKEATAWNFDVYAEAFDPVSFDERMAKFGIADIAKRRTAGNAAFAKRKSA